MTPALTEPELAATLRARYPGDALIAQAAFGSPRLDLFRGAEQRRQLGRLALIRAMLRPERIDSTPGGDFGVDPCRRREAVMIRLPLPLIPLTRETPR